MRVIIINNGSRHIRSLTKLLSSYNPIVIHNEDLETDGTKSNDLIVISGGGHGAPVLWHNAQYLKQIRIVQHHKGPIIGICLGFELITHVFGSHLHRLTKRVHKKVVLEPVGESTVLGKATIIKVYDAHLWSVQHVAGPLVALAKSTDGLEIIKHEDRPIYGFQFHPEVSGKKGKAVFSAVVDALISG
jgi:GMP synthase (glutamine-hydrolysing)